MGSLLEEPRTVLVALDGSPGAEFAFDWAVKHYCKPNDNINLIFVRRDNSELTQWRLPRDVLAKAEEKAEAKAAALIQKFIDRGAQSNMKCRGRTIIGDERHEICKEVMWVCADVLIVGSRGLNYVEKMLLGSVSEYCAHHSACPVIIVKATTSKIGRENSMSTGSELHIPGLDPQEDL